MQDQRSIIKSPMHLVALARSDRNVPVPDEVKLSKAEFRLWQIYTQSRLPKDWNPFDLLQLGRLLKLETEIEVYKKILNASGPLIVRANGNLVAHPIVTIISKATHTKNAIITQLALYGALSSADGMKQQAARGRQLADTMDDVQDGDLA